VTRATRFTIHAFTSHWRAILVIGLGFGLLIVQQATQFKSLLGNSATDKAAAIAGMQALGRTFVVLIPPPRRVDTVAGFVDWRLLSAGTLYIVIYTVIAGAASLRGEEEKGLVEMWLATGLSRATLVACRAVAITLALAAAATLAAAIGIAGTRSTDLALPAGALATTTFMIMLPGLFFFALSMLAAQVVPSRRGAASLVGGIAGLSFVLANLSYIAGGLSLVRWLSPFFYFDEGHSLAEGTTFRPLYAVVLLAATIVVFAAAAVIFIRRDVNIPLMRREDGLAAAPHGLLPYPRRLVISTIYEIRWTILGWTASVLILAALDTASLRLVAQNLGNSKVLKDYLAALGGGEQLALGFLNFAVFVLGATLVATLVVNVIGHFAADQEERRVEIELAQPITPLNLQMARCVALVVATVIPALALLATVVVTAKLSGIDLSQTHLWSATFMVLPLALAVGMIGVAMLPRFNRQAVAVLSAILGLSFLVTILSGLNLPDWLTRLTLIKAYGSPAVHGIETGGLTVLLALVAAGAVATVLQARAEMSSG
jgi:ABC-2 type transport system permease protein